MTHPKRIDAEAEWTAGLRNALDKLAVEYRAQVRTLLAPFTVTSWTCEPPTVEQLAEHDRAEARALRTAVRRKTVPPAPELSSLPLITKGPHKGERWMRPQEFAAWCGVTVATVYDWIFTKRIKVAKDGTKKQSRVWIASGERERRRPPVVNRKRKKQAEEAGPLTG